MKTNFETLASRGLIKPFKTSTSQIKNRIDLAKRDIKGQHKAAVQFAEIALGDKFRDDIHIFDKMRSKRHRVIYDVSGLVSQAEARQALDFAVRYVEIVGKMLAK